MDRNLTDYLDAYTGVNRSIVDLHSASRALIETARDLPDHWDEVFNLSEEFDQTVQKLYTIMDLLDRELSETLNYGNDL